MLVVAIAQGRFASAETALRSLAGELTARGAVRSSFADAVVAREAASPTGVPLPDGAVALPHADPEHVLAPAVCLATLIEPIAFRQMGSPEVTLPVGAILLLALRTPEDAQRTLVRALGALGQAGALAALRAAGDDGALARAAEALWTS